MSAHFGEPVEDIPRFGTRVHAADVSAEFVAANAVSAIAPEQVAGLPLWDLEALAEHAGDALRRAAVAGGVAHPAVARLAATKRVIVELVDRRRAEVFPDDDPSR